MLGHVTTKQTHTSHAPSSSQLATLPVLRNDEHALAPCGLYRCWHHSDFTITSNDEMKRMVCVWVAAWPVTWRQRVTCLSAFFLMFHLTLVVRRHCLVSQIGEETRYNYSRLQAGEGQLAWDRVQAHPLRPTHACVVCEAVCLSQFFFFLFLLLFFPSCSHSPTHHLSFLKFSLTWRTVDCRRAERAAGFLCRLPALANVGAIALACVSCHPLRVA